MKKSKIIIMLAVLVIMLFALPACNAIEVASPENVKYNGSTISWGAVDDADYYLISINGGEEKKVTGTSLAYSSNDKEFSVSVVAINEIKKKIGQSGVTEKTFKPLSKIGDVSFLDDGTATWGTIKDATGYAIMLNGKELENTVSATQFNALETGQNVIQVRAIVDEDDSWYSVWSDAKTIAKLGLPSNVVYDGEYIRWSAPSNGASGYEVYANGIKLNTVSGTSAKYDSQNINFDVTLKAIGNHSTTFDSSSTDTKSFVYLNTVSNITVTDGIVNWAAIDGADSYIVKIDNREYSVNSNSYSGLSAGETKSVAVKPVSNNNSYFSNFCMPVSIRLLNAPQLTWISGHDAHNGSEVNAIEWQQVLGAEGYLVKLTFNGTEVDLSSAEIKSKDSRQFGYAFTETGEYKVYLKAVASGTDIYDSVFCSPITVTRLPAPEQNNNNFIESNRENLAAGFNVNFKSVSGATGYQLLKDSEGESINVDYTSTNQFHVTNILGNENMTTSHNFSYRVRTKGSVNGSNIKLDSLPTSDLGFTITVQAMPQNPNMSGYVLGWDSVSGAQYNIKVGGTTITSSTNSINLETTQSGSYQVSINSRGNGSNILPSPFTAEFTLTRLSAVENLYVTTNENEGTLKYTDNNSLVPVYKNFDIYIDGIKVDSSQTAAQTNINDLISTNNSNIYVIISANSYASGKSAYYMSSPDSQTLTVTRLAPVTFASPGPSRFTNTQFFWNAPSNRNANGSFSPTYIVYSGGDTKDVYHNGELNATVMNISNLQAGQNDFVVKAIGDGVRYLNSYASELVSITKLESPTVKLEDNSYTWGTVGDANNYSVHINGNKSLDAIHIAGEKYSFVPTSQFTSIASYDVKVFAIGDNGNTTIDSEPYQFSQTVKKLTSPEFSFDYSHPVVSVEGKINFTITTAAKMENGNASTKCYVYSIGGATNASENIEELSYSRVVSTPGIHSLSIRAVGGDFDGTEIGTSAYYIASETVGGGSGYQIIILSKLNGDQISKNMDGFITWSAVSNAVNYEYEYVIDGATFTGNWTSTESSTKRSIDISAFLSGHTSVKVRIRAVGNGTNIVTGSFTEKEFSLLK